jgi:hypothetical protein
MFSRALKNSSIMRLASFFAAFTAAICLFIIRQKAFNDNRIVALRRVTPIHILCS